MKHFPFFNKKTSGHVAKDRLKILLISDRINCSSKTLSLIKGDLIRTISKYVTIDEEHTEIILKKNNKRGKNKVPVLYVNIPLLDLKE